MQRLGRPNEDSVYEDIIDTGETGDCLVFHVRRYMVMALAVFTHEYLGFYAEE